MCHYQSILHYVVYSAFCQRSNDKDHRNHITKRDQLSRINQTEDIQQRSKAGLIDSVDSGAPT